MLSPERSNEEFCRGSLFRGIRLPQPGRLSPRNGSPVNVPEVAAGLYLSHAIKRLFADTYLVLLSEKIDQLKPESASYLAPAE